jgi:hypothetical protein
MTIVTSTSYEKAFSIAANELAKFYEKITDKKAVLAEVIPHSGDAIYLCPAGSEGADPRVKVGSDEFSLCSEEKESRIVLTITAGRARAVLYGVYAFLEEAAGCHYFWDGDVIPKAPSIPLENLDLYEKPRFEYRARFGGLRLIDNLIMAGLRSSKPYSDNINLRAIRIGFVG